MVATQVYEYVADLEAALAELARVLRPGGRGLILDTDWDSIVWHSRDPERMRRVLRARDEHLADPYLPRTLGAPRLRKAGFVLRGSAARVTFETASGDHTLNGGAMKLISAFVPGRGGVTSEDAKAWVDDLLLLADANEYFFSLNHYLFLFEKPL